MSRPEKAGWYWLWPDKEGKPKPVEVVLDGELLVVPCRPFSVPVILTAPESWGGEISVPTTRNDNA